MDNIDQQYNDQLEWFTSQGLVLDSRVERRQVNGIYGMYATEDIPKGTEVLTSPLEVKFPLNTKYTYPNEFSFNEKYTHSVVIEIEKGKNSKYFWFFQKLESMEYLKENSCYFYSAEELSILEKMNPVLHQQIEKFILVIQTSINAVCDFDESIDKDIALQIRLNLSSRSWTDLGVLPIFELFNHDDMKGVIIQTSTNRTKRAYVACVDYKANEQIWGSYKKRDMYDFAIAYNYFDPNGTHYIAPTKRFFQFAENDLEKSIFKLTSQRHKLNSNEKDGVICYQLAESEVFLLEGGPNIKLISYIRNNCFQSFDELKRGVCNDLSFDKKMMQILNFLLEVNKVDEFQIEDIPEKLHRFHDMLVKEKEMLLANISWVNANSDHYLLDGL